MKAQKQGVFLSDDRYGVPAWSSDPESETLLIALEGLNKPNPMDLQLEEFVLDNDNLLVAYLTAPWGSRLGIYQKHNRLDWECSQDVGNEIADEDQPICWIKCPGLHNLSMDLFYDPTIEQPPAQWSRERIINHAVAVGGDFSDLFRQILSELQEAYQVCNP